MAYGKWQMGYGTHSTSCSAMYFRRTLTEIHGPELPYLWRTSVERGGTAPSLEPTKPCHLPATRGGRHIRTGLDWESQQKKS